MVKSTICILHPSPNVMMRPWVQVFPWTERGMQTMREQVPDAMTWQKFRSQKHDTVGVLFAFVVYLLIYDSQR